MHNEYANYGIVKEERRMRNLSWYDINACRADFRPRKYKNIFAPRFIQRR